MFRACTVTTIMAAGLAAGPGAQVSRGDGGFFATFTAPGALAGERHHVLVVVHSQLGPNGFVDLVNKINVN